MKIEYRTDLPSKENLYELYNNLLWNDFLKLSSDQLLKAMENSWYSIYTYSGERLIATGRIVSDGVTNAYLCGLGVESRFRNVGIGTEITKKLIERCIESNLHIQLFCTDNLKAYYKKMGFEEFASGMVFKGN